ncbi:MAG TPA: hypothetical protein VEP50_03865 [bacterium]|nr:hypothetical protein [bacterium]
MGTVKIVTAYRRLWMDLSTEPVAECLRAFENNPAILLLPPHTRFHDPGGPLVRSRPGTP